MALGKVIAEARKRKGWKQHELADKVNLSQAQVSRVESGKRELPWSTLVVFADALGLHLGDLQVLAKETADAASNGSAA